ncbi:DISARM anti-phage system protein DrmE domain-containing protein [Streptomyces varsoviensis]
MHGTSITSAQTVGTWVRGQVNGPHDPEDVRRFARAVHDQVLLAQAGWALKTLQIVHRKAGRWLSTQIAGARSHHDDALIDANLGLRVSDLLESVSAHPVLGIDRAPRDVAAHLVGRLVASAEAESIGSQICTG